jgi:hypothetical protein
MNDASDTALATTAPLSAEVGELIPFAHHAEWMAIAEHERSRIKELLAALAPIRSAAGGRTKALKALAHANAARKGWSFANLRTHFYNLESSNWDWRAVASHYRHESNLPADFIAYLRTLCLQEHRSRKQAIEKIRTLWREGKAVPGYGTWREWFAVQWPDRDVPRAFAGDYPAGWSTSNLYLHMPPPAQQALATRGYAAAHGKIPHVIRDTSKLRPLEMIVFDDFECDTLAIYDRRVVRVRGVLAIDVATRRKLAVGFKPLLTDDEGVKRAITRADVQFLIKQIFVRYGVPGDYPVTLLVENAAAAIGEGLEAALDMYFHGQVRVQRTNMLEHRTLTNGFVERGGRPWEKGWIESAFNLMHNLAGSLPGQKGARYDLAPASTAARVAYCELLLDRDPKKGLGLSDEQIAQLRLPVENFDALVTAYEAIFDVMDRRTEHKLLGFDKVSEWTRGAGDAWHPLPEIAALPQAEQLQVEVRERMESPLERWAKLANRCQFVKVPDFFVALLAFTPKKIEIRNRKVVFAQGGKDYVYLDIEGCFKGRTEGEKLLGYFDETAPGKLFVTDLKGRAVGILRHNAPANIKDPEAIGEAVALVQEFFHGQVQGPVREALAPVDQQLALDRAHNAALVEQFRPAALHDGPKPKLSAALADDRFTVPADQRFAGAVETAAGLAAHAEAQAAVARRRKTRAPKHGLGDLMPDAPAAQERDLGKLL